MAKLYKLTDQEGRTRPQMSDEIQWAEGVTHTAHGEGKRLCTEDVIHAYEHPLLAVLFNPIHAGFTAPRLWEAEGDIVVRDGQVKCGVKTLTILREMPRPIVTCAQRVRFGILCALHGRWGKEPLFSRWANGWLDGSDRNPESAQVIAADNADNAAAYAAYAAAVAATSAAYAAAAAATSASASIASFDLIALAEQAITEETD